MSFILDALKKLEREKQAREPGVVMVGPVPWGGADRRRRARTLVLVAVAGGAVVMGTLWWLGAGTAPNAVPRVDREAASGEPAEPTTKAEPAAATSTRPLAGETTEARPAPPRDRAATTTAAPPAAPAPRELDLPVAESETAPRTRSEPVTPDETARAASGETALEGTVETGPEPVAEPEPAPTEESAPDPQFRLTAISTRDGEPIALLNDRLVREGDSFGGVRVVRIGVTDIEIEVDGERRTIGF